MKKNRVVLIITVIILIVMTTLKSFANNNIKMIDVAVSQKSDIYTNITANGETEFKTTTPIYSDIGGKVQTAFFKVGDNVKEGESLLVIKPSSNIRLDMNDQAISNVFGEIIDGEITNQDDFKDAVMAFATCDDFKTPNSYKVITATTAGTIIKMPEVNDAVFPGISFGEITDINQLQIKAKIPEEYISGIEKGQAVNISSSALKEKNISGVVSEITPYASKKFSWTAGNEGSFVDVYIDIRETDEKLTAGGSVKVKIFTDVYFDGIVVPFEAVAEENDKEYVYIIKKGTAYKTYIETGNELTDGVQILTPFFENTVVALNPSELSDGDKVEINAKHWLLSH